MYGVSGVRTALDASGERVLHVLFCSELNRQTKHARNGAEDLRLMADVLPSYQLATAGEKARIHSIWSS